MKKWAASFSNVRGRCSNSGPDAAAVVVDGVVASPQDAAVGRASVVVEAVGGVADALVPRPADGGPLLVAQRLGHEGLVVDGYDAAAHRREQTGERVGGQHDAARGEAAVGGRQQQAGSPSLQLLDAGVLADAHAEATRGAGQSPDQPRRVHHRAAILVPEAGLVGRRGDLGPHRGTVQPLDVLAQGEHAVTGGGKLVDLPGCDGRADLTRPPPVAVDAVASDGTLDLVQVLEAEPIQRLQLFREVTETVGDAVRQRGHAEAAVAPGGLPADAAALEEHDLASGVALLGEQGRPHAGQSAADDGEVALVAAVEGRGGLGRLRAVEPERERGGVGEGAPGGTDVCGALRHAHDLASAHPEIIVAQHIGGRRSPQELGFLAGHLRHAAIGRALASYQRGQHAHGGQYRAAAIACS